MVLKFALKSKGVFVSKENSERNSYFLRFYSLLLYFECSVLESDRCKQQ
jgi:hypothetical protein